MIFLNPWAFLLILVVLWIFRDMLHSKQQVKNHDFINEHKRYYIQTKLILLSLLLLLVALSRPALTNEISKEKFDAKEYIIALDASYSMQMNDINPSRYEVAKNNIISLLKKNTQDRFSLFVFTNNPLIICPPTTDTAIAISALNALEPKYILTKSTSLYALITQISKLEQEHKSLIIFTDGGEEHSLKTLLELAKKSAITINIVAVASKKGTVIIKDGESLKDENSHLVISRINPILKDLATLSGGFYFEINTNSNISTSLQTAMQVQNLEIKELSTDVISYKELYYIPLLLAFIVLLFSLTKAQNFISSFFLLLYLTSSTQAEASLLDFYYVKIAKEAYANREYVKAQEYFKRLTPSQYSYISIANAYYKNKQYKHALRYYSEIKSKNPSIKSKVFYNMANAAFKLKKYQRAHEFYKQSLALEYSQEAYENLLTLVKLNKISKKNVADMLPTIDSKKVKNSTKKIDSKKEKQDGGGSSSSSKRDAQGSQGGSGGKSNKKNKNSAIIKSKTNEFKMGYNAYELINKGYVNEKHPW